MDNGRWFGLTPGEEAPSGFGKLKCPGYLASPEAALGTHTDLLVDLRSFRKFVKLDRFRD